MFDINGTIAANWELIHLEEANESGKKKQLVKTHTQADSHTDTENAESQPKS